MDNKELLLIGGAAVVGLYFYTKNNTATSPSPSTSNVNTAIPAAPAVFSQSYYLEYQYPVMIQQDPNLLNPGYQMSQLENDQYYNNYLDLQQWWNTSGVQHALKTIDAAMQYHWHTYGVSQMRTFLPLVPPSNVPYVPAPANSNSSGSTVSTITNTVLGVAGSIASLLGSKPQQKLNDAEIALLMNGSGIAKSILPFFATADHQATVLIGEKIDNVLSDYI